MSVLSPLCAAKRPRLREQIARWTARPDAAAGESDLGTQLDWVAVDHYNTGNPHADVIVRGVTDDGKMDQLADAC
jgi:type IV secretory pathway VirD2 relaxase